MNDAEPSPSVAKILLDSPSTGPALGFSRTAAALAGIIADSDPRFAIGIFGGWGSGKTTLMRTIQHELQALDGIVVVEFNAWRFEREPQLLVPLLDTIRSALIEWSRPRDAETRERVGDVSRRVARVIRGLALGLSGEVGLPGTVKIKYDVGRAVEELTSEGSPERAQSLYLAAFEELTTAFERFTAGGKKATGGNEATRLVVFVDDLDRCLPANALEVLESMKLFFDLPGFVFVVGLDEDVVQRAVRSRFAQTAYPAATATGPASIAEANEQGRLERDYVEKIFQVPYRLPPMVADQLDALLESMYDESTLPPDQLEDFRKRVPPHLAYVAVDRRVNPREVKRFLNTYTLQTLVRPELDRDTVLGLQTLIFRFEWRPLYEAILTDSVLFVDALKRYRNGDDFAFEDLSAEMRVLPPGLGEYLRSNAAEALYRYDALDSYLSSLESTGNTPPWISEAYSTLGKLRAEIRRVRTVDSPTEQDAAAIAALARELSSRLMSPASSVSDNRAGPLVAMLRQLQDRSIELPKKAQTGGSDEIDAKAIVELANAIYETSNGIYRELRVIREAIAPSHAL